MKQTAVEWLFDNLDLSGGSEAIETLKKAKAMEKEQIETAFIKGNEFLPEWHINNVPYIDADEYYNETFKSE